MKSWKAAAEAWRAAAEAWQVAAEAEFDINEAYADASGFDVKPLIRLADEAWKKAERLTADADGLTADAEREVRKSDTANHIVRS